MGWRLGTHEALGYFKAATHFEDREVRAFPIGDIILIYLD